MSKKQFCKVAVARQGGAMESDTIYGEHSRTISKNGRSSKSQTSRRNLRIFTVLAFVVSLFIFAGCGKDKSDGLTNDIRDLIPADILKGIKDLGMPIYGGNTPPDVTGTFLSSPHTLKASNFNDGYSPGNVFGDSKITLSEQDNKNLTLIVSESQGGVTGTGTGGFIVGSGKKFTIFVGIDEVSGSGHQYKSARLFSGTISEEGIIDFHSIIVMIDNNNGTNLMSNGEARLIYDSDGLAERISSAIRSITGSSSQALLKTTCSSLDDSK